MPPLTLPFSSLAASLAPAGGKGLNLSALARAGFAEHAPPGFIVTPEPYRAFVAANGFQERLLARARSVAPDDPVALDSVSAEIAALFARGLIPTEIAEAIISAFREMPVGAGPAPALSGQPQAGQPPGLPQHVAVRSSATAEDLPRLSF